MYYKLKCSVRKLPLPVDKQLTFNISKKEDITIEIFDPKKRKKSGTKKDTVCLVKGSFKTNKKAEKIFLMIEENNPPENYYDQFMAISGEDVSKKGLANLFQPPQHFKDYASSVRKKLFNPALHIISTLKWRYNLEGPRNPIRVNKFEWSRKKDVWYPMPSESTGHIKRIEPFDLPRNDYNSLLNLANEIKQEPTHYELFRESWDLRSRSTRSSLIIGISSLEVCIKALISSIAPNSQWLINNLQSPPTLKILKEYLPTLPVKNKINGKILPPPKSTLTSIKKGISARNDIVHKGNEFTNKESLKAILLNIKDVL